MTVLSICYAEDMHPYACDGPGKCRHCDRKTIKGRHLLRNCVFCQHDYYLRRKWQKKRQDKAMKEQPQ